MYSFIKGLTELKDLSLGSNRIISIEALANLKNLWNLSLRDNQIVDIEPILKLNKLEHLTISNNSLSSKSKNYITQLRQRGVEVNF